MATTAGGTYYAASSELVSDWPATSLNLANQLESRFAAKANTASPTFTGTVALPSTTTLNGVTLTTGSYKLLGTANPSAASAATFSGLLTTAYDSYVLTWSVTTSASGEFRLRLRSGSTDETASNYTFSSGVADATTLQVDGRSAGTSSFFLGNQQSTTSRASGSIQLHMPASTVQTGFSFETSRHNGTGVAFFFGGGIYNATTAYDGCTFYNASGNITGVVRLWGLVN